MTKTTSRKQPKAEPFRHTPRELAILNAAHAAYMANITAGRRYDVVKRAWVDADEEARS